jgi:hypothetical protein
MRHEQEPTDSMQQRINRLETLVTTLMARSQQVSQFENTTPQNDVCWKQNGAAAVPVSPGTAGEKNASAESCGAGMTVINGNHSIYTPADDWSDVLREVRQSSSTSFVINLF